MIDSTDTIARSPTPFELLTDRLFRGLTRGMAWLAIALVFFLIAQIAYTARPAIEEHGTAFLTTSKWDPNAKNAKGEPEPKFGIVPQIGGTLYSSLLGVALGALFGVAVAIFITQNFLPSKIEIALKNIIELLAAIP